MIIFADQAKQQRLDPNGQYAAANGGVTGGNTLDDASSYATFELRQSRRNTLKSQHNRCAREKERYILRAK